MKMNIKSLFITTLVLMTSLFTVSCGDDEDGLPVDTAPSMPEDVMVMKDGFLASDGIDEASGRYRLTIALSDQKMGAQTYPYYDVMIYVYLKYPMEKIDQHRMKVPFGKVTPFFTNGEPLGDMVYYVGKHRVGEDGAPAFEGTAWIHNKSKEDAEFFVASDVQKTSISIDDLGNGKYKVHGTLYDAELNKALNFSFTDSKPVFILMDN